MHPDVVIDRGADRSVDIGRGGVGLLADHRDASIVDGVVQDDSDDTRVFVRGRAEGFESSGSVEEEILDLREG